jgi:transposase
VLSGLSTAIPKQHSGACEAMRIVSVARRSPVKARTQAINQVRAILVSAPQNIREKLFRVKASECVKACIKFRGFGDNPLIAVLQKTLKCLAKRWIMLSSELHEPDKELEQLTQKHAPDAQSFRCWT